VAAIGLLGVAVAMALFTVIRTDTPYTTLVLIVMLMAAGMSMVIPSMTGSIMSAVPMGKAGVGSAMNDTTRELGGALGVAVLGSLLASRYDSELRPALSLLPANLHDRANESLAGALQSAGQLGGPDGVRVAGIAREAYVSGMHLAAIIAAAVTLLASIIVWRKLPATSNHSDGPLAQRRAGSPVVDDVPALDASVGD
jgi:hypothetical protein